MRISFRLGTALDLEAGLGLCVRQIGEARGNRCRLLLGGDCEHLVKGIVLYSPISAQDVLRAALVCWPQGAQEIPSLAEHMQDWPGISHGTMLTAPPRLI